MADKSYAEVQNPKHISTYQQEAPYGLSETGLTNYRVNLFD